ncbi:hypothetical protein [Variovorax sp.]|uniref:hypothetical protein n=1 Tax=Variovorax sp. TaxID=1871043 RepID=UPI003BAC53D7
MEIIDRSGTTEYTRDAFGRVTFKKQTLINGSVQQVSYAYNANGTLASRIASSRRQIANLKKQLEESERTNGT